MRWIVLLILVVVTPVQAMEPFGLWRTGSERLEQTQQVWPPDPSRRRITVFYTPGRSDCALLVEMFSDRGSYVVPPEQPELLVARTLGCETLTIPMGTP